MKVSRLGVKITPFHIPIRTCIGPLLLLLLLYLNSKTQENSRYTMLFTILHIFSLLLYYYTYVALL